MNKLIIILLLIATTKIVSGQDSIVNIPIPSKYFNTDTISVIFEKFDSNHYYVYIINPTNDTISYRGYKANQSIYKDMELKKEGWNDMKTWFCNVGLKYFYIPPMKCSLVRLGKVNTLSKTVKFGIPYYSGNKKDVTYVWTEPLLNPIKH